MSGGDCDGTCSLRRVERLQCMPLHDQGSQLAQMQRGANPLRGRYFERILGGRRSDCRAALF